MQCRRRVREQHLFSAQPGSARARKHKPSAGAAKERTDKVYRSYASDARVHAYYSFGASGETYRPREATSERATNVRTLPCVRPAGDCGLVVAANRRTAMNS